MRLLAIALALICLSVETAEAKSIFPTQYDEQIRVAVKQFWPDYPSWQMWKAQLFQESRLDPNARSPVGAEGLAQIMPGTWKDIERAIYSGATISRTLAGPAIVGGAYFMASLRGQWRPGFRSLDDRQRLSQASYNGGLGSLLKAQKLCGDAPDYASIVACLPQVTGPANARQTTTYVTMIARWRRMME